MDFSQLEFLLQPLIFVKIGILVVMGFVMIFGGIVVIQIRNLNNIFKQQFASMTLFAIALALLGLTILLTVYSIAVL